MLLLPLTCLAQNGFHISQETGLEPAQGELKAEPKATPAATPSGSGSTEITDSTETTFDESGRVAVFSGDVKVVNPQFTMTCQKLTAFLKKAGADEPAKPAAAEKTGKGPASPAGGLDHALAEGEVIITQDKVDPATGEVTHCVGKGARATYKTSNGEMVLSGWPQIQQGINTQIATAESTVMIMNQDGHLKTIGPSKSVIQEPPNTKSNGGKDISKSDRKTP